MSATLTVGQYFCIFCEFKCEQFDDAFRHYKIHMLLSSYCEICCGVKYPFDLTNPKSIANNPYSCTQNHNRWSNGLKITEWIDSWINKFLIYQTKLLDKTFKNLLSINKVFIGCAVCRYFVDNYKNSGGDMAIIQYTSDNVRQHCWDHIRYNPHYKCVLCPDFNREEFVEFNDLKAHVKSRHTDHITKFGFKESNFQHKALRKLDFFVEYCCDSFFTGDYRDYDHKIKTHENLVISSNISECSTESDLNLIESASQLSLTESNGTTIGSELVMESLATISTQISDMQRSIKELAQIGVTNNLNK